MRIKSLDEYKIEKVKFEKNPDNFWKEKAQTVIIINIRQKNY